MTDEIDVGHDRLAAVERAGLPLQWATTWAAWPTGEEVSLSEATTRADVTATRRATLRTEPPGRSPTRRDLAEVLI